MNRETSIQQILLEIIRGYSILEIDREQFYLKHPSNYESLLEEEVYLNRLQAATKLGIATEQNLLDKYIKLGKWSTKKEEKIKGLRWSIDKSTLAAQKITDNMQKSVFMQSIESQRKELQELEKERDHLILPSAENWARQQQISAMMKNLVFEDDRFLRPVITDENYLKFSAIARIKMNDFTNTANLLRAAFEPAFFDIYCLQYRDPFGIFNKDFFNITIFQKNLLTFASILLNKLRNVEMPAEVKRDPIKIFEFSSSTEKESKVTHGVDDLKEAMKKNGKVTAKDLIK